MKIIDPPIEEIHQVRCEISREFGHDPVRYSEHLRELDKKLAKEAAARRAKRAKPRTAVHHTTK
ncbi:MAG: hypothetical protein HYY24_12590 [Verrucomicrobia bacterium]|nr:hypothetical protein [Verrucomicrobiota bacterium]